MKRRFLLPLAAGLLAALSLLILRPWPAAASTPEPLATEAGAGLQAGEFLAGTDAGLFKYREGAASALWTGGEVRKILRAAAPAPGAEGWYLLSSAGIVYSPDLLRFEPRSAGLPVKTYKRIVEGQKLFERKPSDLKDLETDPTGRLLLACTKDSVYLSRNGGLAWEDLGSPSPTTGLKAVVLAPFPKSGEAAAWASHPIKGLFARKLAPGSAWVQVGSGLYALPGMSSPEELADLVYVPAPVPGSGSGAGAQGTAPPQAKTVPDPAPAGLLWASNSFQSRVYRAEAASASFAPAYVGPEEFGSAESLSPLPDGSLRFVAPGSVERLDPSTGRVGRDEAAFRLVGSAFAALPGRELLSLAWTEAGAPSSLSELWLVSSVDRKPFRAKAENRHGIYLQTGFMVNPASRAKYFALMRERGLDSLVVDLKDDFGRLRFSPRDPLLRRLGKVSSPLDLEAFAAEAKAAGIYLVARIVVFKDEALASYDGARYAVWDEGEGAPWRGYRSVRTELPAAPASGAPNPYGPPSPPPPPAPPRVVYEREYNGERWVDPYSEEVWAYNVAIANEIIARGFDEIQFDYIRFPTDGDNLDKASFRWRDPGLDKESALASFLRFARERIAAPLSIDIYGANGWYRSGVRTGQDVELLSSYVDVICPMLYPSHFEQNFLALSPAEERPYRIYRLGTLRNAHIARGKVVVRPYVQAFFLNVSYDQAYYGPDYVRREVAGVRDAQNLGLTFWNNVGRYDEVPLLEFGATGRLVGPAGPKGLPGAGSTGQAPLSLGPPGAAASAAADKAEASLLD